MSEKIEITISVEVSADWIEFVTQYTDIFGHSYCGYWMYGMEHTEELGWLCFEHDEQSPLSDVQELPEYASIVSAWRSGTDLPEKWHRLNKDMAIKAWGEGVKRYGTEWYEDADATSYDVVIQMAMLGKLVYG